MFIIIIIIFHNIIFMLIFLFIIKITKCVYARIARFVSYIVGYFFRLALFSVYCLKNNIHPNWIHVMFRCLRKLVVRKGQNALRKGSLHLTQFSQYFGS